MFCVILRKQNERKRRYFINIFIIFINKNLRLCKVPESVIILGEQSFVDRGWGWGGAEGGSTNNIEKINNQHVDCRSPPCQLSICPLLIDNRHSVDHGSSILSVLIVDLRPTPPPPPDQRLTNSVNRRSPSIGLCCPAISVRSTGCTKYQPKYFVKNEKETEWWNLSATITIRLLNCAI